MVALAACGPARSEGSGDATASTTPTASSKPFEGMTPRQIHTRATAETGAAIFKKVRGRSGVEGNTGSLELAFARTDCAGSITLSGMGMLQVHATKKVVYTKSDADTWRNLLGESDTENDVLVRRLAGQWVKTSATSEYAKASAFGCELHDPAFLFEEPKAPGISRGGATTVGGQPAITLTYPHRDGGTVTEYVATQGRPYLLRLTKTGPEQADITYYDFETTNPLPPPSAGEVVAIGGS
ncbi:hypothetical protein [Streptomyces sp. NPDC002602]|uniref:hypothetical protein n=1 Tax=Streptomyces sp. NPDC002602 TaxID=3364654 RepID=UPI003681F05F